MHKTFTDQHGVEWVDTAAMSRQAKLSEVTLKNYRRDGRLKKGTHWIQSPTNSKVYFSRDAVMNELVQMAEQRKQQRQVHIAEVRGRCVSTAICPDTRAGLELIRQSSVWTKTTEEKIGDIVLSTNVEQLSQGQVASMLLQRAVKEELERLK
tara:strand:- start:26 stop:481 length:456 start_codon:yes stop_codon:yes gene_type:complete